MTEIWSYDTSFLFALKVFFRTAVTDQTGYDKEDNATLKAGTTKNTVKITLINKKTKTLKYTVVVK